MDTNQFVGEVQNLMHRQPQQLTQQQPSSQHLLPLFPPVPSAVFATAYPNYCSKAGIHPDPSQLNQDGRQIDLHQLHVEVINLGTFHSIMHNDDAWAIIGGKLGFVQFQASDTEPVKCSPDVATHLQHVYKKYLSSFDLTYIASILQRKNDLRNQNPQANEKHMPPQDPGCNVRIPPQNSGVVSSVNSTSTSIKWQRPPPTPKEEEQGAQLVDQMKCELIGRLDNLRSFDLPDHQRLEFDAILEQVYQYAQEIEPNLPRLACFWKPEAVRHVVAMIVAAQYQKHLLDSRTPQYTIELNALRHISKHFQAALEQYNSTEASLCPEIAQN
ncbi:hypothetical protein CERSUDRAFT_114150 [Gelatoporia subvermispora B]|uniref:ARID domain-containing protein n=1 Tax=Ceriporiopsis subvermispora (strain B) TaxID=914234 RepID=M2PMA7_CERS8|nr:hypothetical protein CERSUDRAFT_114150 [Gelatoporia subvermispora B]